MSERSDHGSNLLPTTSDGAIWWDQIDLHIVFIDLEKTMIVCLERFCGWRTIQSLEAEENLANCR